MQSAWSTSCRSRTGAVRPSCSNILLIMATHLSSRIIKAFLKMSGPNVISNVVFSLRTLASMSSLRASLYFRYEVFGFDGLHVVNIIANRFLICSVREINLASRNVTSQCCSPSSELNFWQASLKGLVYLAVYCS
jgi:hypothetical protein